MAKVFKWISVAAFGISAAFAAPAFAQQNEEEWDEEWFENLDAIAVAVLNQAQTLSFQNDLEYCGYIAYDDQDRLRATRPLAGEKASCQPDAPASWELVASYHTHGAVDLSDPEASFELPSSDDLLGDIEEGIDGYVSTPGGRLWFIDGLEEAAILIGDAGTMRTDPNYVSDGCEPLETHYLEELIFMEEEGFGPCELEDELES